MLHVVPTFIDPTKYSDKRVERYVHMCIEITWLMCVQDPPMVLVDKIDRGADFDTELFRRYDYSDGDKFDYLVWPALLSHRNSKNPVVKGIAKPIQLKRDVRDSPVDSRGSVASEGRSSPKSKRNSGNNRSKNPEDWIQMDTNSLSNEALDYPTPRSNRKGQTPPSLYVRGPTRDQQQMPKSPYFNAHVTPVEDDATPRKFRTPPSESKPVRDNLTVLWKMKRPERSAP